MQEELEKLGVPYTGCGPEASRVAFDKVLTKKRLPRRRRSHRAASWCLIRPKLPGPPAGNRPSCSSPCAKAPASACKWSITSANGRRSLAGGLPLRHASVDGGKNPRARSHGRHPGRPAAAGGRGPGQTRRLRLHQQIHARRRRAFLPGGFSTPPLPPASRPPPWALFTPSAGGIMRAWM